MEESDFFKKPIEKFLEKDLIELLDRRDSSPVFTKEMFKKYPPTEYATSPEINRGWELAGLRCLGNLRFFDGIEIFSAFYDWLLEYQEITGERIHKGNPLVWIAEIYTRLGYRSMAKRFLMLTLIEDSITSKANIRPETSGIYFRLVWQYGMSDSDLKNYAHQMYKLYQKNLNEGLFPEWILQEIDNEWMIEIPSPNESMLYRVNSRYVGVLLQKLGDKSGTVMERLAEYILSQMPGCRTYRRKKTYSTDYDIVCALEGIEADFRSDLGRYFVCECKDWDKPADFTTIAKFCRVLDSAKCRFGIIFSKQGITGEGRTSNAARELLKVFQQRELVVIVIDFNDFQEVGRGKNFIALLRGKYEKVRLDLY